MSSQKTKAVELRYLSPSHVQVLGLLSVDTVAKYQDAGYAALRNAEDELNFDLAHATIVGSAVIALLLAWQRKAVEHNKTLCFSNASDQLLAMADLSGVRELIPFVD